MPKKSAYRQEYMKQRRRVQSLVNKAKKRGYSFPENIIPAIPKNITKASVNRLSKLTPDYLYSKATVSVAATGKTGQAKTISGTQARAKARSQASKKAAATRKLLKSTGVHKSDFAFEEDYQEFLKQLKAESKIPGLSAEEKYRASKWLTDELAQTLNYPDAESMLNTKSAADLIRQLEAAGIGEGPQPGVPSGPGIGDFPGGDVPDIGVLGGYPGTPEPIDEDYLVWQGLQERMDEFQGEGAEYLRSLLRSSVERYGDRAVAKTLADLEKQDPNLMYEIDNLTHYLKYGTSYTVSRAFKSLANAIAKCNSGNNEEYAKALGKAMDNMQVFNG